jgi:S-adenosylmethionine-diacylglycerol 3-amino-3-carboxypropyl transferase
MGRLAAVRNRLRDRIFTMIHGRNLVYNTCWEDPALDRVALQLRPDDSVLVITSAGCNALDYLLAGAGTVHAVDLNPRQNALLELKCGALRGLDYPSFFELFGQGATPRARAMYHDAVRRHLSPPAARYWDRHIDFFAGGGWRHSFYYRGTSGFLARLVLTHARAVQKLRRPLEQLLAATTLDEQRQIYENSIRPRFWTRGLRWFLARSFTLSLLGVPRPQRQEILTQYPGGIAAFIQNAVETVMMRLPFTKNYFWRVYMQGHYDPHCCPEYLTRAGHERLRGGLLDRLHVHTTSVTDFLRSTTEGISKFVLLDHMDWMSWADPHALAAEWNAILARARPSCRVIFRSAGLKATYLDRLRVRHGSRDAELGSLLRFHPELAATLHEQDRVHTYGSFYIADLPDQVSGVRGQESGSRGDL